MAGADMRPISILAFAYALAKDKWRRLGRQARKMLEAQRKGRELGLVGGLRLENDAISEQP